ncbi:hypothetical protein HYG86_05760 [Alkalicella caledoniensis]|uniref:Uncharacterized protein n=1 Tax=Alkalicella caledoniensis TaxID=2731377 RepID=A0A7G9W6K1_ALKCA|nr:hypothetical protein [Alkalicella caledoniensis]QNO14313.1 hypothetical protein HYG86_05760 [Alkalicella caledoniensis]
MNNIGNARWRHNLVNLANIKNYYILFEGRKTMIIEGAFLKIPETLISYEDSHGLYEGNITNLLAMGVVLELNARNIDNPLRKIQMEKRYDISVNSRCDMFLDFTEFWDEQGMRMYGSYNQNWIEAKYFGGLNRNSGNETKSENAGSIIYDIFRLVKNIPDDNLSGKYAMVIFNDNPSKYLAFSRKDGSKREWLEKLFKSGTNCLEFSLQEEPNTIKKLFNSTKDINLKFKTKTTSFEPRKENSGFWGYLIQVLEFKIVE